MTIRDIAIAFGFEVDKDSEAKAEKSITDLKNMATKLLGAIGIGFSLTKINQLSEEFNGINDTLKAATREMEEQEEIQQAVLKTANDIRVSYGDAVNTVSKLVQQNRQLFDSTEKTLGFVELTTKAWKAAGRSESEISSLNEAMNKTFALGTLNAANFQRILQQSPETIGYMEKALGKSREQLYAMAQAGTLSADTLYTAFTGCAGEINAAFDDLDYSISDALTNIRNRWGLWVDGMNSSLGIADTIGRTMVKAFDKVMGVLQKAQARVEWLAEKVGGTDKLLRMLAVSAAAIFVAFNFNKLTSMLGTVGKLIGGINLKTMAIVAVVLLLALLIEDFIGFMKGNDSVIGALFEKAGIDAEQARQTIINAWGAVKDFLIGAWTAIQDFGRMIWGKLGEFWEENGDSILGSFQRIWGAIWDYLQELWNRISTVAQTVFGALQAFWDTWGDKIKNQIGIAFQNIGRILMAFLTILEGIIEFITGVFTGDWDRAWNGIKIIFTGIWQLIKSIFIAIWETILNFFGDKIEAAKEMMGNLVQSIKDKAGAIKDRIVEGFNAAIEWIKALPKQALEWGADIVKGIADGIKGAIGKVSDAAKGVANKITSFLHFSVPDEGPLTEYESWMPDFMSGLADGITRNRHRVADAAKSLAGDLGGILPAGIDTMLKNLGFDLSLLASSNVASPATAGNASVSNSSSRSVVQNVEINNDFHGSGDEQRQASKAMDKSAGDATGELARALAYV